MRDLFLFQTIIPKILLCSQFILCQIFVELPNLI